MKKVLAIFMILSSSLALADFSGKHQGSGRQYDSDGLNIECSEASITITQSSDKIELGALIFQCGENIGIWEPLEFSIQGTNLFLEGKKVGDISHDTLNVKISDLKTGESEIIYLSTDSKGVLNLSRMWNDPSNRSWLTFEASFKE